MRRVVARREPGSARSGQRSAPMISTGAPSHGRRRAQRPWRGLRYKAPIDDHDAAVGEARRGEDPIARAGNVRPERGGGGIDQRLLAVVERRR